MTLFTGKGDNGTTKTFNCDQRISKSSAIAEALGSLDEINSFLGLCKVQANYLGYRLKGKSLASIVHEMQENLFIIQAEIAGADKFIEENKVKELEETIAEIEKEMLPIKSFFISGGVPDMPKWQLGGAGLGAIFDIARTIARRAERRVIAVVEEMSQPSLLNIENKENPAFTTSFAQGYGESKKSTAGKVNKHTKAYLNRLSSALYVLARYSNLVVGIIEEAPNYR